MRATTRIIPFIFSAGLFQTGTALADPYPVRYWAEEATSGEAPWVQAKDTVSDDDRVQHALDKGQDLSTVVESPAAGASTTTTESWPHRYRNEGYYGTEDSDVAVEYPK